MEAAVETPVAVVALAEGMEVTHPTAQCGKPSRSVNNVARPVTRSGGPNAWGGSEAWLARDWSGGYRPEHWSGQRM